MRFLTVSEARDLDVRTIAAGTPGVVLMERAAAAVVREVVRAIAARPERGARVVVLAGPGNNGGDGFEVARLLLTSGRAGSVESVLVGEPARLAGDAAATYERLLAAGGRVRHVTSLRDLEPLGAATLVVDALFGTGLNRPIEAGSIAARTVIPLSTGRVFVVAVDVPSGLSGDETAVWMPSVRADVTVTFGAPKRCHVEAPAAGRCGRIVVADIGLLRGDAPGAEGREVVVARDAAPFLPPRPADGHKGTFGRLAVVGGSVGMAGAPALAARAALRAGVGLVTVAAPDAVRQIVHVLCPEATTSGPDIDPAGFDAVAVGPGLGRSEEARGIFVRLASAARPTVFDADALTVARLEIFAGRRAPTVLTPHPGEAGRLLGMDAASVNADRIGTAKTLALRSNAVVVLKGFRTVVAAPDGRVGVVLAGNPGMATGGAGDVLTGITGALLARGLSAWDAARTAVWLHGAAGDLAAEALGEESVVASDLVESLPGAFSLARDARPG
jgi:ADP-dependent NAD(P)H-hydrate dehydratase / NAD(P)H-hydrate epimerase